MKRLRNQHGKRRGSIVVLAALLMVLLVGMDPDTQHLWKTARVARITSKGTAQIVWNSGEPIRPVPFPASRSRQQWEDFLTDLRRRWGGQWASPSR